MEVLLVPVAGARHAMPLSAVRETFPLHDLFGVHPLATAMLHDLIAHLGSDRCQPKLRGV